MIENQTDEFPAEAVETAEAAEAETPEAIDARPAFDSEDRGQQLRLLEAILFAAAEPLTREAIALRMPKSADLESLIDEIEQIYTGRGINLIRVAGKLTLRTAPDLVDALKIERTVSRRLSRAAIETLAIIGYHQPITRAEVEEVRGVALSRGTLDLLMEAGWIQPKGHRETPGRPATWVTTEHFLLHFGIDHLNDLPGVEDLKAAGLLDARPAVSAYSEEAGLTFPDAPGEEEGEAEEPETVDAETGETPAEKPQGG